MLWVGITNGGLARACVSLRAVLRVNYSLSGRIAVLFLASQLTIVSLDVAIYYNYISWSKLTSLHYIIPLSHYYKYMQKTFV